MPFAPKLVRTITLVALTIAAACAEPARTLHVEELPSPAGDGAVEPFVSVAADGRVHLSWLERAADSTATVFVASLDAATKMWTTPKVVVSRKDLFVNWADFPSVVPLSDGRLLAHWLQRNGAGRYAYDVVMSESRDGGDSWSATSLPHDANVQAEHGFASILPTAGGGAQVSLLDGSAGAAIEDEKLRAMQLGWATWANGGVTSRAIVDEMVCDCCQTAMAMTTQGPLIVYRDRSDDGIRDMSVVRSVNGAWTAPKTLHDDGWKIDFCPVNGPAVSALGDTVGIVWFTGADSLPRVQATFSTDGGATFAPPVRVDSGVSSGRVDIEMLDGGAALVTWLQRKGGQDAEVMARVVRRDGTLEPPLVVSPTSGARSSGFPRMARTSEGVVLAWVIPGTKGSLRVAAIHVQGK